MRKYVLFIFSFFLLTGYFSFQNVTVSYAVPVNERCNGDEKNPPTADATTLRLICDAGLDCVSGRCINPQQAEQLNCACLREGVPGGNGENGIKCLAGETDLQKIRDSGAPVVFCSQSEYACQQTGEPVDTVRLNRTDQNHYSQNTLRGVRCETPKPKAICNCVGKGTDGENNFECYKEGENSGVKTGGGWCKTGSHACVDTSTNPPVSTDHTTVWKFNGFLEAEEGYDITGIRCAPPEGLCECKNPNHPGRSINGFRCTLSGKGIIDTDYCDSPIQACINTPDPNHIMTKQTQKGIFKDAPLKGIDCVEMTPVPPPPPPCADPLDAEGRCKAFDSAFGRVNTDAGAFITSIFAVLLSVSGGVALLLIIKSGYQLMISAGNPEKINAGREQLIAAIVGLLFIIFSFVILEVIGIEILRLPGFGGAGGGGGTIGVQPGSVPYGGQCTGNADCANPSGGIQCTAGVCIDPLSP